MPKYAAMDFYKKNMVSYQNYNSQEFTRVSCDIQKTGIKYTGFSKNGQF